MEIGGFCEHRMLIAKKQAGNKLFHRTYDLLKHGKPLGQFVYIRRECRGEIQIETAQFTIKLDREKSTFWQIMISGYSFLLHNAAGTIVARSRTMINGIQLSYADQILKLGPVLFSRRRVLSGGEPIGDVGYNGWQGLISTLPEDFDAAVEVFAFFLLLFMDED
jgi:hypothetical protein